VGRRRLAGEPTRETGRTSGRDGERPFVVGLRLEGLDVSARGEDGLAGRVDRSADGEPEDVLKPSQASAGIGRPVQMNTVCQRPRNLFEPEKSTSKLTEKRSPPETARKRTSSMPKWTTRCGENRW
jgi:hypothetical protein